MRLTGRAATKATAYVIARDKGICALCGHPGANTLGHKLPIKTHPQLARNPNNWQAEHGRKHTQQQHGFDCPGNIDKGATQWTPPPSRNW